MNVLFSGGKKPGCPGWHMVVQKKKRAKLAQRRHRKRTESRPALLSTAKARRPLPPLPALGEKSSLLDSPHAPPEGEEASLAQRTPRPPTREEKTLVKPPHRQTEQVGAGERARPPPQVGQRRGLRPALPHHGLDMEALETKLRQQRRLEGGHEPGVAAKTDWRGREGPFVPSPILLPSSGLSGSPEP